MLLTICAGCATAPTGGAETTLYRLDRPMTELALALSGEDVALMRRAGRAVIAIYDAGRGR